MSDQRIDTARHGAKRNSIISSSPSNNDHVNSKKSKVEDLDDLGDLSEPEEVRIIETDNNNDGGSCAGAAVEPGTEGVTSFNDYDVLSGRGGGTNVHPGNRNFRDLINLHRRAYLKARKNDKPAISRAIVRSIRENNGRFLRKDEVTGLWLEIGDEAAREKTSQALRQRAPEMRKLLFDTEQEEARAVVEEHLRQQQQQQQQAMIMTTTTSGGINLVPPGVAAAPIIPTSLMTTTPGMIPVMMPAMHPGMMHPAMMMLPTGQPMFTNPMLFPNITNGGGQLFPTALYGGQGTMNQLTQPNGS